MIPSEMMIVNADGFTMLNARMISAIVPESERRHDRDAAL